MQDQASPSRPQNSPHTAALRAALEERRAKIGIVGMGYVGLPIALAASGAGYAVLGFDINEDRARRINAGEPVIRHIEGTRLNRALQSGRFSATADFERLAEVDAILLCVPTPLSRYREPDLSYVVASAEAVARTLRPGQLVILESTTYPGTTADVLRPILEAGGLKSGEDFFIAFSPEREDPGNADFETSTIPKVVGGDGPEALELAESLYGAFVNQTVAVSSTATAEAVKLTENIFRAVNIALVNELKGIYEAMDVDVWEVIDAAKTKPFGFMPFYPGPGLGGHCIPIDPFYLTWKAREYEISTRFIELAGEINTAMPRRVVEKLAHAMDHRLQRGLSGAKVLVLGLAYKKNVDDLRESPALRLIELLEERGAICSYHDPYFPEVPRTREHVDLAGRKSVELTAAVLEKFDCVLIATDHDDVDYRLVVANSRLVVDTRNICVRRGIELDKVVKA